MPTATGNGSVRSGFSDNDLPIGLQIVAGRHRDDLVPQAAYAFEQARPWNDRGRSRFRLSPASGRFRTRPLTSPAG
jgi:Asp-tRNA(Asn)/Glu-tRNA(Gln) amidotransferase A subunit family amidase